MNNLSGVNIKIPTYDEDCECLEICRKLGGTYERCHKGASTLISRRCSADTRQSLLQNDAINRKPLIWVVLAGIGGIVVGALGTLLGQYLIDTFLSR